MTSRYSEIALNSIVDTSMQVLCRLISTYMYDYDDYRDFIVVAMGYDRQEVEELAVVFNTRYPELKDLVREHIAKHGVSPFCEIGRHEFRHNVAKLAE